MPRAKAPQGEQRERDLKRRYGIDKATYDDMLEIQGGKCAICLRQPRTMRLAVDHNHKTGVVRGLLCMTCNHKLLGGAHDSIRKLVDAALYLENPPAWKLFDQLDAGG